MTAPPLAPDELDATWREYFATRSAASRNRIAEHFIYIADTTAHRLHRRVPAEIEFDDLRSVGAVALLEAIAGYEPARGRFTTYAYFRIYGAMIDYLRDRNWLPRRAQELVTKIAEFSHNFQFDHARKPEAGEIAEAIGIDIGTAEYELRRPKQKFVSIDNHNPGEEIELAAIHSDPSRRLESAELIHSVFRNCTAREQEVLTLYYWDDKSLAEAGKTLGLSKNRVCQIHAEILRRLRRVLKSEKIST